MEQVQLPADETLALVAYTHEVNVDGSKEGNVYFECNRMLRLRSLEPRAKMMKTWGVYVHYLLRALGRLPNIVGVVYRAQPDKGIVEREYKMGRSIQWSAFTSTVKDFTVAATFTDRVQGVIFKITVGSGRDINAYSFFPQVPSSVLGSARGLRLGMAIAVRG